MSREDDIQELCKQVLESSSSSSVNGNGWDESRCPFCGVIKYEWSASMEDLEHDLTCAYLIAKDLSTNY